MTPEGQSPTGVGSVAPPPNTVCSLCLQSPQLERKESEELVMATGELNPNHYPAQRAAKVVQHYLNTCYGSPYRLFGLHRVHSANAQVCC